MARCTYFVAFVNQLMGSCDCLQAVHMVELSSDLVAKEPACSSRAYCPCINILGIAPHQVTECTLMRNLLSSGDHPDLIDGANFGAETAVHAEHCSVHDGSEHEEIKHLTACLPHRCVAVLCLAFLVEAVDLCDLSGLVVSSDKDDSIRISAQQLSNSATFGLQGITYFAFRHIKSVKVSRLK